MKVSSNNKSFKYKKAFTALVTCIKKGAYKTEGENKKSFVEMRLALQKYTINLSNICVYI